jgi:hypothetical protein
VLRRLHDDVPSAVRAGVASGVGTLTWVAFVPFAIALGLICDRSGVGTAGWVFVVVAVAAGVLLVLVLPGAPPTPAAPVIGEPVFPAERFLPDDDPAWPGHWAFPPREWTGDEVDDDRALVEVRAAILALPPELRQVIVLRDVEGRSAEQVGAELGLSAADEIATLHRARGLVRERLERHLEGRSS